jgi:hypothetical protein
MIAGGVVCGNPAGALRPGKAGSPPQWRWHVGFLPLQLCPTVPAGQQIEPQTCVLGRQVLPPRLEILGCGWNVFRQHRVQGSG